MALLAAAGLSPSADSEVTFYAEDGFYATLRVGDLTAARHYYGENGARGQQLPAVLSPETGGYRLYFGQLAALEQTSQAFV